jgi:hypothetical protein
MKYIEDHPIPEVGEVRYNDSGDKYIVSEALRSSDPYIVAHITVRTESGQEKDIPYWDFRLLHVEPPIDVDLSDEEEFKNIPFFVWPFVFLYQLLTRTIL